MIYPLPIALAILVVSILAVRPSHPWRQLPLGACAAVVLVPILVFTLYWIFVGAIMAGPFRDWNANRLTPAIAFAYGYDLYYGPDRGPIICNMYGPVNGLVFVPAALAASPTAAIMVAGSINVLFTLVPLVLMHLQGTWRHWSDRTWALLGACLAIGGLLCTEGTAAIATNVHADGPTVGLGLLACLVLTGTTREPGWGRLLLSALLAVLATWTKQVEFPLFGALAFYLWLAHGFRTAIRFVVGAGALSVGSSVIFFLLFGFKEMFFNLIELPAHQPWYKEGTKLLFWAGMEMGKAGFLFGLVVLWGIWATTRETLQRGRSLRDWLREEPWCLVALAALFLVSTSLLGRVKMGGWRNAFHSLYYVMAAASWVLVRLSTSDAYRRHQMTARGVLLAGAVVVVVMALPLLSNLRLVDRLYLNPHQQAYEYDLKYPGRIYFPFNVLSMLMAEGKLYNDEPGVLDRGWASLPPPDEHLRRHIPTGATAVAYHKDRPYEHIVRFLPEFKHKVTVAELPGWIVYEKEAP